MKTISRIVLCLVSLQLAVCCGTAHGSPPDNSGADTRLTLSAAERDWLGTHPTVRIAFDGYFPPYSFLDDDGHLVGLAVDIMAIVEQRLGVTFEVSSQMVWKNLYDAAKRRHVDMVATMGHRPEREKWFVFTQPYINKSLVIMTRKETNDIRQPDDLNGRRLVVVSDYQYVRQVLAQYPAIIPYSVNTMAEGLTALSVGKADAAITFLGAGTYLMTKYQLSNLKFAAVLDRENFTESIGVRGDWPEFAALLDKVLDSIPEQKMIELRNRWLGPPPPIGIQPRTVFIALAGVFGLAALLVTVFTLWNRMLKKQVAQKTRELQLELAARRQAVSELRESEERFRAIFNASNDAFFIHEIDTGAILQVNKTACDMFGRSKEEMLRVDVEALSAGMPPYSQKEAGAFLARAAAGTPQIFEWQAKGADGCLFWVEVSMRRAVLGEDERIIAAVRKITERKEAETALKNINIELEQRVKARTKNLEERTGDLERSREALQFLLEDMQEAREKLERANAKLTELDRLKSMFIASMSHELRTPLNSIIGFSAILHDEWLGPLNEEQKKNQAIILRSGKHLLALINDIIDVSKIEAGMLEVTIEEFDLYDLVAEAVATLSAEATDKGLDVSIVNKLSIPMVTDRRRLLQCLLNILGNAVKFTDEGSVRVEMMKRSEGQVELRVSDTGIGIAEDDLATLFQPFTRLHAVDDVTHPGTGLGLYLTQKLVREILAGEITLTSTRGKGSTCVINIPREVS